ncbi:FAD dependent oxidoreductase [Exophiala viscosa]|uniref:FAD dependent oxidoreductase n=1 Tax=Exophiala viscosa TaxID=2486360 RepID=UPI002199DB64|nr:FAD dependent oxidoreductase [Exophiala viscosa]
MIEPVRRVAVVGAGVSGVTTAAHLLAEGVDVTVFERAPIAGGVWVFDPRVPHEPAYPSMKPSVAESTFHDQAKDDDPYLLHSPPGPAYESLTNNVATEFLQLSLNTWKAGTQAFVRHHVLAEYIQETAVKTGVHEQTLYNTEVRQVSKDGNVWRIQTSTWDPIKRESALNPWLFDAVVVASGHYHAPRVPDIPGLAEWKRAYPSRIQHSKRYRNPEGFDNQTVLIIGGSASSGDIAKELGPVAKKTWQSTRGGKMDVPESWLPPNCTRVTQVASFGELSDGSDSTTIPGKVVLADDQVLENIDRVIIATGYHFTLPFFPPEYHQDHTPPAKADDKVLITDGTMLHNLHKDIFYILDPTLAFTGVPFYTATFSLFEFQAIAIAAVFSGQAAIPSQAEMRAEYDQKVKEKGHGKPFHTLIGEDVRYAAELMEWVNKGRDPSEKKVDGYSKEWIDSRDKFVLSYWKTGSKENIPQDGQ